MKYIIGQKERRDKVGLKGRSLVTWMACKICQKERWVNKGYEIKNTCISCTSRKSIKDKSMNSASHKKDCKCHKCRIGKGYFKGDKNPMWKGGIKQLKSGYVYQWVSEKHPFVSMSSFSKDTNYILQHRLVMAESLNRPLSKKETVHHINGIRNDNRIENLELWESNHQSGQRTKDLIKWAIEFLKNNNYKITKNN